MPAELMIFEPWLQEPLEAGALTVREAWNLDWEYWTQPDRPYPQEMLPLSYLRYLAQHHEVEVSSGMLQLH